MFRSAPFPLYGLPPSWQGTRYLASSGQQFGAGIERGITELGLGHRDPAEPHNYLNVEVRAGSAEAQSRMLAEDLWFDVELQRAPHEGGLLLRDIRGRPDPEWSNVTINVDGEGVQFRSLAAGDRWLAWTIRDGNLLVVHGTAAFPIETAELVRITNVEPYCAGRYQSDRK